MKLPDIDIDLANRNDVLKLLDVTPAAKVDGKSITPHGYGVYFQKVPVDPFTKLCSIDYNEAEERGYTKIDLLNVGIYSQIKDPKLLDELLDIEPNWDLLEYEEIVDMLFQLNGHFDVVQKIKPRSITDLAICVAMIRPGKKHLIRESRETINEEIWKSTSEHFFKKSHSFAYATVIKVNLNWIEYSTKKDS